MLAASLCLAAALAAGAARLIAFLAFLAIFQAAAFGAFQIRGDQLRSGWVPAAEPSQLAGRSAHKPEGEPMPFKEAGRLLGQGR